MSNGITPTYTETRPIATFFAFKIFLRCRENSRECPALSLTRMFLKRFTEMSTWKFYYAHFSGLDPYRLTSGEILSGGKPSNMPERGGTPSLFSSSRGGRGTGRRNQHVIFLTKHQLLDAFRTNCCSGTELSAHGWFWPPYHPPPPPPGCRKIQNDMFEPQK